MENGKWRIQFSILAVVALIAGIYFFNLNTNTAGAAATSPYPILSACSGNSALFPRNPRPITMVNGEPRNALDDWKQRFDDNVRAILEAHLKSKDIECANPDSRERPSSALIAVAEELAPWRDASDRQHLSELDMSAVLLEYLRVYECALREHDRNAGGNALHDQPANMVWNWPLWTEETFRRRRQIADEMILARASLTRALRYTGGIDRMKPFDTNFECLQRSSLDIRNVLGLAADTAACLPKIWDARGSLRDLYEEPTPSPSEVPPEEQP